MTQILLLNEWVFHDLMLENGEDNFRETARFLIHLQDANTMLVVPHKQRWLDKAFRLIGDGTPRVRSAGRLFSNILRDSDRTIWTNYEEMQAVSEELYRGIPDEDIYLVKAYHCAKAHLLVTTDMGLFHACQSYEWVNCQIRDEFLRSFSPRS